MLSEVVAPTDVVQDLLLVLCMLGVFLCHRLFCSIFLAWCFALFCSSICGNLSVFHRKADLDCLCQILMVLLGEQFEEARRAVGPNVREHNIRVRQLVLRVQL